MTAPALPDHVVTARAGLRPFRFDDVDAVLAYANDEEWSRYMAAVPYPYLRADAIEFIARQALLDRTEHAAWAIVVDGAAVGGINVRFRHEHQVADVGWSIDRRLWGRGLVTEVAQAIVDQAFRTHAALARICSFADSRNVASLRVMEKIGMQWEGTLRQNRLCRGVLIDEAWYGLLRSEWETDHAG
jgi:RimJ/RimL family protein N-acetyltransferase